MRSRPLVIAHRGASAYLPEHTLEGKALAFAMGADYLEQDVVATRDDELIVLHDIHLDDVTDVGTQFADRARSDGHFYARDFTLEEIRTLTVSERLSADGQGAHYPGRFPPRCGRFRVPTLSEEIDFIQGLVRSTGRPVGIYPEIKRPAWHRDEGIELGDALIECLARHGYDSDEAAVYVQCFDFEETRRLARELGTPLPLVQLLGENDWGESGSDYDYLKTPSGLAAIAEVASGIGPWIGQILTSIDAGPGTSPSSLVADAHAAGLTVHPYTFRADDLPAGFESLEQLLDWALREAGIDGFFHRLPGSMAHASSMHWRTDFVTRF